jgi:hypothetical protein
MEVGFRALRRANCALAAVCLVGAVGCSPVGWGVNEVQSLIHHHSSHTGAPTKALEAATTPDAEKTPPV